MEMDGGRIWCRQLVTRYGVLIKSTHLFWHIAAPDVTLSKEGKQYICSPPLPFCDESIY